MEKNAKIESIRVIKYRTCLDSHLKVHPNLTVLIGPNGAGKTNLLIGILLLKKIANSSFRPGNQDEVSTNLCELIAKFKVKGKIIEYKAKITYSTDEQNSDQVIEVDEFWRSKEINKKNSWFGWPMSSLGKNRRHFYPHYLDVEIFRKFNTKTSPIFPRDKNKKATNRYKTLELFYPYLEEVFNLVSSMSYYSASRFTNPSECPTSFEIEGDNFRRGIYRNNREHMKFMMDLYSSWKSNDSNFKQFYSIVSKLGLNLIDELKYREFSVPGKKVEVRTGGKLINKKTNQKFVIPSFIINKTRLSPNQLSEGTFKSLAILFYLVTDESKCLLIEEPEVCIHHGLLLSIIDFIMEFSQEKQIILTTHSDFVLDRIAPENVLLVKYLKTKGTMATPIQKALSKNNFKALKVYLNTIGNLGEYWRHGELEDER